MKRVVWLNKSNSQLCVTIPKNTGIEGGDIVSINKEKIKTIVYSFVVGDLFHYGHLNLLQTANKLGDCIVEANGKYNTLKDPFDKYTNNLTGRTFVDIKIPIEVVQKIDIINNPSKYAIAVAPNLTDIRFLLTAHITRNFVNHSTKIDGEFFRSYFVEIYKSLIFTVFYMFKNK